MADDALVTVRATMHTTTLPLGEVRQVHRTPYIDGLLASGAMEIVPAPPVEDTPKEAAATATAPARPARKRGARRKAD